MEQNSKNGGESGSITASTASLNRKLAISSAPRMLTESEIALLQQSMHEIAEWIEEKQEHRTDDERSLSTD